MISISVALITWCMTEPQRHHRMLVRLFCLIWHCKGRQLTLATCICLFLSVLVLHNIWQYNFGNRWGGLTLYSMVASIMGVIFSLVKFYSCFNFSNTCIWIVGCWLTLAMQCWNRNQVSSSVTLMITMVCCTNQTFNLICAAAIHVHL